MKGIEGVGNRIDGLHERIDRVVPASSAVLRNGEDARFLCEF